MEGPRVANPQRMEVMNPASHAYTHWIAGALDWEKKSQGGAGERMPKYTESRRTPPLAYKVGDDVMLSTAHLKLKRPSPKLDQHFISPFQIQQHISPTVLRLTLRHKWKMHPTFHVTDVELFVPGNRPVNYIWTAYKCAEIKADEEYDMDEIKISNKCWNGIPYHVESLRFPTKND